MIRLEEGSSTERLAVGGKAYHLNELMALGFRVPATSVVVAEDNPAGDDELFTWVESIFGHEPWTLAVRSSSSREDTTEESKAGHFLSVLGAFDRLSLVDAIERVRRSGPEMAVIIQPLLRAQFAGVLFSCDPLTYSRESLTIVWTPGLADRLVSGDDPGNTLRLCIDGQIEAGVWPASPELLGELVRSARVVESKWGRPVDLEWVVDTDSRLWMVQARPVVLPSSAGFALDSEESFARLPALVRDHPKIRLRRQAFLKGVTMAPAAVEVTSSIATAASEVPNAFGKSAGVSIVLLHPERVEQQIIREFAPVRGSDVDFFTRTCRRYSIRRYPRSEGLSAAKASVHSAGLKTSWVSVAIVQAIWAAHATGIIHRTAEAYIIELALGHFVPKGVVPTSTIVLSPERSIVSATWRDQSAAYHFMDGHVVTETPPREQLRLDASTLAEVARTFDSLFDIYGSAILEFGILEGEDGPRVYLIDVAESSARDAGLDSVLIASGVLSPGSCRGRVLRVDLGAVGELDRHLHDRLPEAVVDGEGIVVLAERASVELLPFVGAANVVGFIFQRGSVLAHLSVVLREKGIPAVVVDDPAYVDSISSGAIVDLDAATRSMSASERVRTQ